MSDELQIPSPDCVSQYIPPAAVHDEQLSRYSIIGSQSKQSTESGTSDISVSSGTSKSPGQYVAVIHT